jgi:hypothetical protein
MIFATQEMMKYRLRELKAEAARTRMKAPRASREERTPPPRVVLFRGRRTNMRQLAIDTSLL